MISNLYTLYYIICIYLLFIYILKLFTNLLFLVIGSKLYNLKFELIGIYLFNSAISGALRAVLGVNLIKGVGGYFLEIDFFVVSNRGE